MGKLILLFVMFCGFLWGVETPKNPAVKGIVDGASFTPGPLAPGSFATFFGTGLDLVQEVSICNHRVEVVFQNGTQINVLVPENVPFTECAADLNFKLIPGQPRITSVPRMVQIVGQNISLFLYWDGKNILPIITTGGTLATSIRPGQEIQLWATGVGRIRSGGTPEIPPVVTFGGFGVEILDTEEVAPGVYRITGLVPVGIPDGVAELFFGLTRPTNPAKIYRIFVSGSLVGDTTPLPPPPSPREEKEKRPGPRLYPCWKGCEEKE